MNDLHKHVLPVPTINDIDMAPAEALPALALQLAALQARLAARMAADRTPAAPASAAPLVDVHEMARLLAVPVSQVRERVRRGTIPCIHVGHHLRFDPAAVLRALNGAVGD